MALGMWNLLVWVDRYQLDIVGLTSNHSVSSGTFPTLELHRVRGTGHVWILTSPLLAAVQLEIVLVDERVTSMQIKIPGRKTLTVVCAYAPNNSLEYFVFLGVNALPTDSLVLLGGFNAHVGNDWEIGRASCRERVSSPC